MNKLFLLAKFGISFLILLLISDEVKASDLKIIKSNDSLLQFELYPEVIELKKLLTKDGSNVILPSIKNTKIKQGIPGSPLEIVRKINFAVPEITGFRMVHQAIDKISYIDGVIAPYPSTNIDIDIAENNYEKNEELYKNHPLTEWISVRYGGIASDVHIGELDIVVARYNHQNKQIEIPEKITISISFKPSLNSKQTTNRPNYEFLINPLQAQKWGIDSEVQ